MLDWHHYDRWSAALFFCTNHTCCTGLRRRSLSAETYLPGHPGIGFQGADNQSTCPRMEAQLHVLIAYRPDWSGEGEAGRYSTDLQQMPTVSKKDTVTNEDTTWREDRFRTSRHSQSSSLPQITHSRVSDTAALYALRGELWQPLFRRLLVADGQPGPYAGLNIE